MSLRENVLTPVAFQPSTPPAPVAPPTDRDLAAETLLLLIYAGMRQILAAAPEFGEASADAAGLHFTLGRDRRYPSHRVDVATTSLCTLTGGDAEVIPLVQLTEHSFSPFFAAEIARRDFTTAEQALGYLGQLFAAEVAQQQLSDELHAQARQRRDVQSPRPAALPVSRLPLAPSLPSLRSA
jgi:hypothetical protein